MENQFEFDELQMYYGYPYSVNKYINIRIPTVGEIIEFGEKRYYGMIYSLTSIPSDMKSQLDDAGIDYEEITDFQLFYMLAQAISKEDTNFIFSGNAIDGSECEVDFSKFQLAQNKMTNQMCLCNYETGQIIDELAYLKIANYLRMAHNITSKVEKAANKTTKKILIQLDRDKHKKNKDKPYKSTLKPLISAMMRYPGFKYKSNELKGCTIYEFMDTVQGSQIYIQSTALLQGSYSGMIDTSKIQKKNFDWMRSVSE